ncbi:uncharacterized protein LOC125369740 [Ricinus communis]|uniref:uncharacterized protein LOC125369740 n=1 Tax=Ricinus communis TaxID=3988 RepID=UPI00201AA7D9|nr:uncharacterized protein LOC125369740 [Ricinus communis]
MKNDPSFKRPPKLPVKRGRPRKITYVLRSTATSPTTQSNVPSSSGPSQFAGTPSSGPQRRKKETALMPESRRVKFISSTKSAAKAASAKATASKGKSVPSYARLTIASSTNNRPGRGRGKGAKNGGRDAAPVRTQESQAN